MTILNDFLKHVGALLDLPDLEADSSGICLIEIKPNKLEILFEYDEHIVPGTIVLSSHLVTFNPHDINEICLLCLHGNAEMPETLSIKENSQDIFLHTRLHPKMTDAELKTLFIDFQKQAEKWKKTLKNVGPKPQPGSSLELFPYKA